ncbi:MAG: M23 family metallopeptidase [Acidobacteriota bacterium]
MAQKFFTVILVPNAKACLRRFTIPYKLVAATGIALLTVCLIAGVFIYRSARIAWQVAELETIRSENAQLRQANVDYHKSTEQLKEQINQLREYTKKLNTIAGIEDPSAITLVGMGGIGGFTQPTTAGSPGALARPLSNELSFLKAEAGQLEDQMQSLSSFFEKQSLLLASTPSIWPTTGYLSCGFGWRLDPFTKLNEFHQGIDISSQLGQPIVAPSSGVVVATGSKGGYGNVLILDHDFGYQTRYGHLRGFAVREGQSVKRGQIIAYVGNTGKSTGPHLHYEVWVHDQAVNPIQFILEEYMRM